MPVESEKVLDDAGVAVELCDLLKLGKLVGDEYVFDEVAEFWYAEGCALGSGTPSGRGISKVGCMNRAQGVVLKRAGEVE